MLTRAIPAVTPMPPGPVTTLGTPAAVTPEVAVTSAEAETQVAAEIPVAAGTPAAVEIFESTPISATNRRLIPALTVNRDDLLKGRAIISVVILPTLEALVK